jgi:hypothetical protein
MLQLFDFERFLFDQMILSNWEALQVNLAAAIRMIGRRLRKQTLTLIGFDE